jgi:Cu-processing system permease protein
VSVVVDNSTAARAGRPGRARAAATLKVMKYGFFDLLRSRWIVVYTLFFLAVTSGLLYLGGDVGQAVLSTLNLVLLVVPLVSLVLGLSYYYYTRDFVELILTQPIARSSVFLGHFLGVALPLAGAFLLGTGLPFLLLGRAVDATVLASLLVSGALISVVFAALGVWIALLNEERIKALGIGLAVWLGLTILYDGLLLWFIVLMQAYPVERALIGLSLLNPIDLSRILVLLQLDTAALMGYTGAVFQRFLGSGLGAAASLAALLVWTVVPVLLGALAFKRKDF